MIKKLNLVSIIDSVILLSFIIFSSFAFASGPAPLNDESVVREIKGNIPKIQQAYLEEKGHPEAGINTALFLKNIQEEAFAESGYDFSDTLSKMANEGFNKEDRLVNGLILPLIFQISYMGEGVDFLSKVFSETDAKNILKIMFTLNAKNQDRDVPDYNVYDREEIDLLLRDKWESMTSALKNGDIEAAIQYFVSKKKSAYREVFSTSSGKIKYLIESTKNMEILDFNLSRVKYIVDFEAVVDGVQKPMSSYIIFERDEDGLWKILFF